MNTLISLRNTWVWACALCIAWVYFELRYNVHFAASHGTYVIAAALLGGVLAWCAVYVFRAWLLLGAAWTMLCLTTENTLVAAASLFGFAHAGTALYRITREYMLQYREAITQRAEAQAKLLRECTVRPSHPRRRTVILTASDGFGHLVAARTWSKRIREANPDTEIICIDVFELMGRWPRAVFQSWEYFAMYIPELHGLAHWLAMHDLRGMVRRYATQLATQVLTATGPEVTHVVICHPLAAAAGSILKHRKWKRARITVACTDFFINPHGFSPGNEEYRLPLDLVEPTEPPSPEEKRRTLQELGLSSDQLAVLVLAGGSGLQPPEKTYKLFRMLKTGARHGHQFVLVCGTNQTLARDAREFFTQTPNVHILERTDGLRRLLPCFDGVLGKPGGLSSAEILQAGVAFGVWYAWRGQERKNLRHLLASGATYVRNFRLPLLWWLNALKKKKANVA